MLNLIITMRSNYIKLPLLNMFRVSCFVLLFIFLLLLFPTLTKPIFAAAVTSVTALDDNNNPLPNPLVDENSARAAIHINGLLPNTDYSLCLGWGPTINVLEYLTFNFDQPCNSSSEYTISKNDIQNSQYDLIVCAKLIHSVDPTAPDFNSLGRAKDCQTNDYFHADEYHYLIKSKTNSDDRIDGNLQVAKFIPNIQLSTSTPKPNQDFSLTIKGNRRIFDDSQRNEYNVKLNGTKIGDVYRVPPPGPDGSVSVTIPGLGVGNYSLDVYIPGDDLDSHQDKFWTKIDGLVAHYDIACDANNCSINGGTEDVGPLIPGENPCQGNTCKTGIGNIPTTIGDFGTRILAIAGGIGGAIAFVIMVIGGIQVLTSGGDQQRLNAGRERIIAALAGLLFLIFAVLILQFLGLNILGGIPGI